MQDLGMVIHEVCSLTPGFSIQKKLDPSLPLPKIPGGRYYEEFLKLLSTLTTDNLVDRADCDAIMNDTYLLNHFRNMQKQYS